MTDIGALSRPGSERPIFCRDGPLRASDLGSLCEDQRIFDIDAQIPYRVLDLRMAQQDLDRSQVAGGLVDHRCLRATKRMRAVLGTPKSDGIDPLVDKPGILACAEMANMIDAAWKCIIVDCAAATFEPGEQAGPDVSGQLKLHRLSRLLLDDYGSGPDVGARNDVANLDLHQVTAAQLAVDRQVEQRPIAKAALPIQEEAYSPDLLLGQRSLGADCLAGVPCGPALRG